MFLKEVDVIKFFRYTSIITAVITLCFTGCTSGEKVEFVQREDAIDVLIGGENVTSYVYKLDLTKPVLYPIRTLSGIVMTRGYPFEDIEGESHDHPHHTGVFFTYDEVNDNRFWATTTPSPQITHVKITEMIGGIKKGTLSTVLQWIGRDGNILLEEKRTMVFQPGANEYAIDFSMTLTAVDTTVVFKDTKEGMFAIRVAHWLREKDGTGAYLSSRSATSAKSIWGRRAEWVLLEGEKDGRKAGIVIMNHPASMNYPTFWHARDYGLFSANPLGQSFFRNSLGEENPEPFELTLQKDESALFKFRMIIYDGPRNKIDVDQKYNEYSEL